VELPTVVVVFNAGALVLRGHINTAYGTTSYVLARKVGYLSFAFCVFHPSRV
jgi:hypothetical protein